MGRVTPAPPSSRSAFSPCLRSRLRHGSDAKFFPPTQPLKPPLVFLLPMSNGRDQDGRARDFPTPTQYSIHFFANPLSPVLFHWKLRVNSVEGADLKQDVVYSHRVVGGRVKAGSPTLKHPLSSLSLPVLTFLPHLCALPITTPALFVLQAGCLDDLYPVLLHSCDTLASVITV